MRLSSRRDRAGTFQLDRVRLRGHRMGSSRWRCDLRVRPLSKFGTLPPPPGLRPGSTEMQMPTKRQRPLRKDAVIEGDLAAVWVKMSEQVLIARCAGQPGALNEALRSARKSPLGP